VPIFGFIAGLGGRDITPSTFKEITNLALKKKRSEEEIIWIGVKR
jgi:pyruvate/2-oxoacid:ferredoxin oxidoreductase alpha subunit